MPAAPCGPREGSSPSAPHHQGPASENVAAARRARPPRGPCGGDRREALCTEMCVGYESGGGGGLDRVGRVGDTVTDRMRGAPLG